MRSPGNRLSSCLLASAPAPPVPPPRSIPPSCSRLLLCLRRHRRAGPTRGQRLEKGRPGEAEPGETTKTWFRLPTLAPVTRKSGAPEPEPSVEHPDSPLLAGLHPEPGLEAPKEALNTFSCNFVTTPIRWTAARKCRCSRAADVESLGRPHVPRSSTESPDPPQALVCRPCAKVTRSTRR
jgi:hypothetical protein